MKKGFVVIGLYQPFDPLNVGGILRAMFCYSADMLIIGNSDISSVRDIPTDTYKAWRHIPTILTDDIWTALPVETETVAVEINLLGAEPLFTFTHPARTAYIFGPENGSLPESVVERCNHKVHIPTPGPCMNLASTANVVLYDRLSKSSALRV